MVSGVVSSIGMLPPCAAPRRPRATTRTTRQVANFLTHIRPSTRGFRFSVFGLRSSVVLRKLVVSRRVEELARRGGDACVRGEERSDPARHQPRLPARGRLPNQRISWVASRSRSRDNTLEERCPAFPCGVHRDDDYTRECPGRPLRGQTPTPARPGGIASP